MLQQQPNGHRGFKVARKAVTSQYHTFHSVCVLNKDFLVVTGSLTKKCAKSCEKYSILADEWTELPFLTQGRDTHASCALDQRYVYVFGGYTDGEICEARRGRLPIERLDMADTHTGGWQTIELTAVSGGSGPVNHSLFRFGVNPLAMQVNRDTICIAGGEKQIASTASSAAYTSYIFDVENGTMRPSLR